MEEWNARCNTYSQCSDVMHADRITIGFRSTRLALFGTPEQLVIPESIMLTTCKLKPTLCKYLPQL